MKPIDVIKEKIYDDLQRYSSFTMCEILGTVCVKGVGVLLRVVPFNIIYNDDLLVSESKEDPKSKNGGKKKIDIKAAMEREMKNNRECFYVPCINRPPTWMDNDIIGKYYACVLGLTKDNPGASPALLVPKTILTSMDDIKEIMEAEKDGKQENKIIAWAKSNIFDKWGT